MTAYCVRGIRSDGSADFHERIAAALGQDGPVLVDAVVSRMMLLIPPAITVGNCSTVASFPKLAPITFLLDCSKANLTSAAPCLGLVNQERCS
jgi:hypothetical protein